MVYGILKRVVWYFEKGGVVLRSGWCGIFNMSVMIDRQPMLHSPNTNLLHFDVVSPLLSANLDIYSPIHATSNVDGVMITPVTNTIMPTCTTVPSLHDQFTQIHRYFGTLKRVVWYFEEVGAVL